MGGCRSRGSRARRHVCADYSVVETVELVQLASLCARIRRALLTYYWPAFTTTPVVDADASLNNISHVMYAGMALGTLWFVAVRIRRQQRVAEPTEVSDAERMVSSAPGRATRSSD